MTCQSRTRDCVATLNLTSAYIRQLCVSCCSLDYMHLTIQRRNRVELCCADFLLVYHAALTSHTTRLTIEIFAGVTQQLLVDTILCLRVCAIYGRSKKVVYGLSSLLATCTAASVSVIAFVDKGAKGMR